ncbi:Anthranilate synthase beta subunit 1, chloroplastic [Zea mays]|uniref:Anthranilate synthase beta subunit 1, chloroplastic n=1 Tax=Zea mays TaxID=4577 RepID=A0A317YBX7_MAIZE|nr:Anthranilate synthase beta subunit 1, chloroplastic [Zea mays]
MAPTSSLPDGHHTSRLADGVILGKAATFHPSEATVWTEDGLIMVARHKKYKHIQGVQFHPESIITPEGKKIILNFVRFIEELKMQRS